MQVITMLLKHDSAKALDSMPQEEADPNDERAEDLPETEAEADADADAEDDADADASTEAAPAAEAAAAEGDELAKEVDAKLKL